MEKDNRNASHFGNPYLFTGFKWCCHVMQAQCLIRAELYYDAMYFADVISADWRDLKTQGLDNESLQILGLRMELHRLYILSFCKWVAPDKYRTIAQNPEQILIRWWNLQNRLLMLGDDQSLKLRILSMTCGQSVIQMGIRYCHNSISEAMRRFNLQFGTNINPELRHYASKPGTAFSSHWYWSIELAKVMYNGDMDQDELEFLMAREHKALLAFDDDSLDIEYAEASFSDFRKIFRNRFFCQDSDPA